ncbi:unnamed protein product [Adineta steineri]|uniref:Microtubule-associated protein 1A/B/S-like MBL-like domain-containing protein n=1 Tax=Adineta steineri TaxID=433720 RepID=A0A814AD80_9BILA|nr:unnamed protein product [Adineta steineri]CAF0910232.1 unnamed protein product [Adineta steineri]
MSTAMNKNSQHAKSTVGLLLVIGDITSNEQRDEICFYLRNAFKHIDINKYHEIHDLFNNLIHENQFQIDSQYRQIANTENGSIAGFLYLPSFHTLLNVFRDLFNTCYHVCILFCGQQIDSNGALILSDSLFTSENFHSLFEENTSYVIQDLEISLPYVSNQWMKLSTNYLQKQLENVQIYDLSNEINEENSFGQRFYERLLHVLNNDFDIYSKLIPRNNSGTIAFDEPNLYILYGQQGEASLFGVRGFVVLVNGGFSRIPSYWNLIRGLQNIDACILTHFDYDVFPGLQTILHRKTILSSSNDQLCKPDIGAFFLNHTQRTKIQSIPTSKSSSSTNKLVVNLNENIDEFLHNIKQLNINTFNLIKHTTSNKQNIEPISLYKKIAFGSLDLYVLHPTTFTTDDDKLIASLQKIPIHNKQVSSSMIPLHHWYSSCSLLVWTPTSKSSKDTIVRILYTGACPQTLVFEALNRVRHLEFLHDFQPQRQTVRTNNIKTASTLHLNTGIKHSPPKSKISPPVVSRVASPAIQNKTTKDSPRPPVSKPKVSQTTTVKTEKPRSVSSTKKQTTLAATSNAKRSISKDKKVKNPTDIVPKIPSKPKQVKNPVSKLKPDNNQKQKLKVQDQPKKISGGIMSINNEQKLETPSKLADESETNNDHQEKHEEQNNDEQILQSQNEQQEDLINEKEYQPDVETETDDEHLLESQTNEYEQSDDNEQQLSADELDESNEQLLDNHENEIHRPESVSLIMDHNESLIESTSVSPIDESTSQLTSQDPMTRSFIDGGSDTENPFTEKVDDDTYVDDEMEIIHHNPSGSAKNSVSSIEDINPQGLPIEKEMSATKSTVKKLNKEPNRTNNSNQASSHQSGSIFNVDVAYIPYHGNESYVDSEFFRRIRARYYILNAVQVSRITLESLIDGKQQWNTKEHVPVTLVPTFDGEQLRQFFITNKNRLAELNINILPASTRCNVQYDNESSPAQLLRFHSMYHADE